MVINKKMFYYTLTCATASLYASDVTQGDVIKEVANIRAATEQAAQQVLARHDEALKKLSEEIDEISGCETTAKKTFAEVQQQHERTIAALIATFKGAEEEHNALLQGFFERKRAAEKQKSRQEKTKKALEKKISKMLANFDANNASKKTDPDNFIVVGTPLGGPAENQEEELTNHPGEDYTEPKKPSWIMAELWNVFPVTLQAALSS